MKAGVLKSVGHIQIEDVPEPQPGPDEVKIKVAYCGICGTDPEIIEGRFVPPEWTPATVKIPGHESSGVVVAVGDKVKNFKSGDLVACNFRSPCGTCYYCRSRMENFCESPLAASGGFAEYAVYKESSVYHLPADISLEVGAFLEPTSIAVHLIDLANVAPGGSVAILGGGPIGLLALQVAVRAGAVKILLSEPVPEKRILARKLGATVTVDPLQENLEEIGKKLTGGRGFRTVIDVSGKATVAKQALSLVDKGATVVWASVYPADNRIEITPFFLYQYELTIRSIFLSPYCFPRALDLLSVIDVKSLTTNIVPLADISQAFEMHKQGKSIKILIKI